MAVRTKTKGKSASTSATGKAVKATQKQKRHELVMAKILEIDDRLETSYLNLSQLLSETYHKEYPELWGYEEGPQGFRDFCDAKLSVGYRKSMYMIDIWDKVIKFRLDKKKVAALGWTKMKDIVTVINAKNAAKWLEKAKKMSSREVTEACKISKRPDSGKDVPSIVSMKFQMGESEANIVTDALSEAKKLLNTTNDTNALEYICQEWMGTAGVTPERASLADHIKGLEVAFGVNITTKVDKKKQAAMKKAKKEAEAEEEAAAETAEAGEGDEVEFTDLSKAELLEYADEKELDIPGAKSMNKKTLRAAIEEELTKPPSANEEEEEEEPLDEGGEEGGEGGDSENIDDLLGL